MRLEAIATHDVHSFYLRWEILYEGKEKALLAALGGPLFLEMEASDWVDTAGVHHEKASVKVAVWPHPGPRSLGQARFRDGDARRRFWVNLAERSA